MLIDIINYMDYVNLKLDHNKGAWQEAIVTCFVKTDENIPEELIPWVEHICKDTDFLTAPASTQFHGNVEQGLVKHSMLTAYHLLRLVTGLVSQRELPVWQLLVAAIFHDLCKVDTYMVDYRNTKNEKGEWVKVPYFKVAKNRVMGHGVDSMWQLKDSPIGKYLDPKIYEAVRWHMGSYEVSDSDKFSHQEAMKTNKLVLLLEMADRQAAFWDGL